MPVSSLRQPLAGWTTRIGQGQDLIAWAAGEGGRLLADLPQRWIHTQEVALHALWAAAGLTADDQQLLVAAAYLHDIGYAEPLADTGFHPLDGAVHLTRAGHPDLARLVAHHSGAAVEARHRGLTRKMAAFPRLPGPVADALTYCDVTTGPRGDTVDPGPRLEEIVDRHGAGSIVARSRTEARVDMYSAVVRTLRRVSAARPGRLPFTVDTVLLGCVTLIRPQGSLASPDASRALQQAVTRALDDGEHAPHSLVIDCEQATGFSISRLQTALTPLTERPMRCVLLQAPASRHASTDEEKSGLLIERTTSIPRSLTPHCACT